MPMTAYDYELLTFLDEWERQQPTLSEADDARKAVGSLEDLLEATMDDAREEVEELFVRDCETAMTPEAEQERQRRASTELAALAKISRRSPWRPQKGFAHYTGRQLIDYFMKYCIARRHVLCPEEIDMDENFPAWRVFRETHGLTYEILIRYCCKEPRFVEVCRKEFEWVESVLLWQVELEERQAHPDRCEDEAETTTVAETETVEAETPEIGEAAESERRKRQEEAEKQREAEQRRLAAEAEKQRREAEQRRIRHEQAIEEAKRQRLAAEAEKRRQEERERIRQAAERQRAEAERARRARQEQAQRAAATQRSEPKATTGTIPEQRPYMRPPCRPEDDPAWTGHAPIGGGTTVTYHVSSTVRPSAQSARVVVEETKTETSHAQSRSRTESSSRRETIRQNTARPSTQEPPKRRPSWLDGMLRMVDRAVGDVGKIVEKIDDWLNEYPDP